MDAGTINSEYIRNSRGPYETKQNKKILPQQVHGLLLDFFIVGVTLLGGK